MMSEQFNKGKQLIVAIILGILTYWLFAQSFLNIAPHVQRFYDVDMSIVNIAVSLTSLLTGVFIVVAGGLSDKIGRVKITYAGLILSILGSIALIISHAPLLLVGRVLQGLSAACLLPATIALINSFFHGEERQKGTKLLVIWFIWWNRISITICWNDSHFYWVALDFRVVNHFLNSCLNIA